MHQLRTSHPARIPALGAVLAAAFFSAACEAGDPPPAGDPTSMADRPRDPTARRGDAPPYAVHGPFSVGYRQLEADGSKPLAIKAWYPALNPSGAKEEINYQITLKRSDWPSDTPAIIHGHAIAAAPIDNATGPYPLVIFSHGFSLNPEWYSALVEHYASIGFIVLAPEHVENDWFSAVDASFDRPLDIKQTLDFAETLAASGGAFAGAIDLAHVAVVGHSYGGYTALMMGGAQFDLDPFNARCAALTADDPKNFLCAPFLGREPDMAARAGLASAPSGLWPPLGDPRVTAIIPIAGDAYLLNEAGLVGITVPIMAIGGTDDFGTPWEWGSQPSYEFASSDRKSLVAFEGANHMIAANPCESMSWSAMFPPFEQEFLCLDPVWDRLRALDLMRHFSSAFLLDTLKGDTAAHEALLSDAVHFPGIGYTTTLQ